MLIRLFMMKFLPRYLLLLINLLNQIILKSNLTRLAILLSLFIIALSSCKKDPYEVGFNLLPGTDTLGVNTIDTVSITAYSLIQDSIRADKRTLNVVGSMMDPVFGLTSASFYSQFRLSAEAVDFGVNPVLDSIVLQLRYAQTYGDTNTTQTLKVYEVSQDLEYDSSYYTNQHISTYDNLLAEYSFKPRPSDSVPIAKDMLPPHIRINLSKLTNYFGNKILSTPAEALGNNTSFLKYMKGLAVKSNPVTSGGGLIFINPSDKNSKLVLYFHNTTDTSHIDLIINNISARASLFDHNGYLDAIPELRNQIVNKDTTLGKEKLYVQGLGGIQVKIRFPYLSDLKKLGKISLNSALLVMKNIDFDTTYAPVPSLFLMQKDSLGRFANVYDYIEGSQYYGGVYDKAKKTYSIRLTRQIEKILLGKIKNLDLYLIAAHPAGTNLIPNRVILRGTNPLDQTQKGEKLQLKITYTKIY